MVAVLCSLAFVVPGTAAFALWSSTATATLSVTTAPAFTPPTVSCAWNGATLDVNWTASPGATSYRVYSRSGSSYTLLMNGLTGTSLSIPSSSMSGLPNPVTVVMRAFNGSTESADSNAKSVKYSITRNCVPG